MAKHALIITVKYRESIQVTTQEFATAELAHSAAAKFHGLLANSHAKVYSIVVPIN